eukprot:2723102-Pleurochrysis_carterae.AAC.1
MGAYLNSIGCPLDVRAKGFRNPEQKVRRNRRALASSNICALVQAVFDSSLPTQQAAGASTAAAATASATQQQQLATHLRLRVEQLLQQEGGEGVGVAVVASGVRRVGA